MVQKPKDFVEKHEEGVRYIVFGILTVIVSWTCYSLLALTGIDYAFANGFSWFCAVIFAYFVNKYFVFKCTCSERYTMSAELLEFLIARAFTGAVAIILFPALMSIGFDFVFLGVPGLFARGINTGVEIVLNYVLSKFVVFRSR